MYIKYAYYKGKLAKGDIVLMSAAECLAGGSKLKGVPTAITPDGKEPVEPQVEPDITPPEPVPADPVQAKIDALEARLAKIEAVPLVTTALEPVIKEPTLAR